MKINIFTFVLIVVIVVTSSCSSDDNQIKTNLSLSKHVSLLYDQSNPTVAIDSTVFYLQNGKIERTERSNILGNTIVSDYSYNSTGRLSSIAINSSSQIEYFDYNVSGDLISIRHISSNGNGYKYDYVYLPNRIEVMYSGITAGVTNTPSLSNVLIFNSNGIEFQNHFNINQNIMIGVELVYNSTNNLQSRINFSRNLNTMQTTLGDEWNTTYTTTVNPVYEMLANTYGNIPRALLKPEYLSGSLNVDFPTRLYSENIVDTHTVTPGQNWPMVVDFTLDSNGVVSEINYTTTGGVGDYIIRDKFYY